LNPDTIGSLVQHDDFIAKDDIR
jgi:hypothetical protein